MLTANCSNAAAAWVTNEISPISMLVPILIKTEIPIVATNSTGSIHELVDSKSISRKTGIIRSVITMTSDEAVCLVLKASTAGPRMVMPPPFSFSICSMALPVFRL